MIPPRNLLPGQYQIGNLIFGRGTTVPVENFDIKPYDVNPQDHQVSMSDETRFGIDSFKPTTIEITFHVLYNELLPKFAGTIPNFWKEMPKAADFQREWRFDEGRKVWGSIKPLYCCGKDGVTRMVFGRPRHFTYAKDSAYTESVQCLGEFQRSDTLAYTAQESYVEMAASSIPWNLNRSGGDSDSWIRILAYGPMTNPKFTVGNVNIDLNYSIVEGEVLEICSYPWMRRAVDSKRVNLAAYLAGTSEYLDRMKLPYAQDIPVRWTSSELNTWMPDLGNQTWEQDIGTLDIGPLPTYFTVLRGKAVVRYDFTNTLQLATLFSPPSKYISSSILSSTTAIIDNTHKFATNYQYSEARISDPWYGKSGIVIMSDAAMTNFVVLQVRSDPAQRALEIRTGTAPNVFSANRAQWINPAAWKESDTVGIGYDPATKTYQAYFNRAIVASWADTTNIVNIANRSQGYIFDMDATCTSQGTGFRDMLSYDRKASVPNPIVPGTYPPGPPPAGSTVGRAFLFWNDAWSTIV